MTSGCLICEHLREKETALLDEFADGIINKSHSPESSEKGLCQQHLRAIMNNPDERVTEYCVNSQKVHYEQLLKELNSFIGKSASERFYIAV